MGRAWAVCWLAMNEVGVKERERQTERQERESCLIIVINQSPTFLVVTARQLVGPSFHGTSGELEAVLMKDSLTRGFQIPSTFLYYNQCLISRQSDHWRGAEESYDCVVSKVSGIFTSNS